MEVLEHFSIAPLYIVLAHTNVPAGFTSPTPARLDGKMRDDASFSQLEPHSTLYAKENCRNCTLKAVPSNSPLLGIQASYSEGLEMVCLEGKS